jgi:hypothetical protein
MNRRGFLKGILLAGAAPCVGTPQAEPKPKVHGIVRNLDSWIEQAREIEAIRQAELRGYVQMSLPYIIVGMA